MLAQGRVAVELCCGFGGIGIALRHLGYQVGKAFDSWEAAVAVYNHNVQQDGGAITCDLLSEAGRATVAQACRAFARDIDLLAAGPPCKGFSQIINSKDNISNPHNRVLEAIPDYVALLRPRLVLIENVPNLRAHRGGATIAELVRRLQRPDSSNLRYRVEYGIFDAAQYGVPQVRKRVLLLAVRAGDEHLPDPSPDLRRLYGGIRHSTPIPQHLQEFLTALRDPENLSMTTAKQALSDLPVLGAGEVSNVQAYASEPQGAFQRLMRVDAPPFLTNAQTPAVREDTVRRLQHIPPGGSAYSIPHDQLNGLSRQFSSAYRRLHPDCPSTVLSTKYDCAYHYSSQRSLSVREYCRLQGIPDRIEFPTELCCRRSAYEMVGNAVPPLLIEGVLGYSLRQEGHDRRATMTRQALLDLSYERSKETK